jgi:hypothetical protein
MLHVLGLHSSLPFVPASLFPEYSNIQQIRRSTYHKWKAALFFVANNPPHRQVQRWRWMENRILRHIYKRRLRVVLCAFCLKIFKTCKYDTNVLKQNLHEYQEILTSNLLRNMSSEEWRNREVFHCLVLVCTT